MEGDHPKALVLPPVQDSPKTAAGSSVPISSVPPSNGDVSEKPDQSRECRQNPKVTEIVSMLRSCGASATHGDSRVPDGSTKLAKPQNEHVLPSFVS